MKHWIALCGELAWEEGLDLSQDYALEDLHLSMCKNTGIFQCGCTVDKSTTDQVLKGSGCNTVWRVQEPAFTHWSLAVTLTSL
jgi:hypothetical protein